MHFLAVIQFPFLFLSHFFIGLSIYGSDFQKPSGKIYLLLMFLVWFVLFLNQYKKVQDTFIVILKPVQVIAILSGLYLYSLLHLNYWNEHSTLQAILLLLLGLGSLITALVSSKHVNTFNKSYFLPLLFMALIFLANVMYPLIAFMVISLIILWHFISATPYNYSGTAKEAKLPFYSVVILWFLLVESFLPIWDFQEVLYWPYLSFSFFVGLAISGLLYRVCQNILTEVIFHTVAVILIVISVVFPSWVLGYSHMLIFGVLSGMFLSIYVQKVSLENILLSVTVTWFWAGFISLALYQNITKIEYRIVLLLVLLIPLIQYIKSKKKLISN